jgi:hypothetical protein
MIIIMNFDIEELSLLAIYSTLPNRKAVIDDLMELGQETDYEMLPELAVGVAKKLEGMTDEAYKAVDLTLGFEFLAEAAYDDEEEMEG